MNHATAIITALLLVSAGIVLGAPARTGIGPDTEEPPDDLVCELGADPNAESVDPSRWAGRFGGIGIQIGFNGDAVTVDETMKDGPAEKAGVRKGDQITRINDESAAGLNVNDVVRRLRGEPGSALKLTVFRADGGQTHECRLQRGLIKVESVRDAQLLGGKVGYARLTSFNRYTGSDLRAALAPLERAGARAWVLDLRHNRGGLLRAVRDVAGQFLEPAQSALVLRPAQSETQQQFFASRYGPRLGGPLCVLINLNTAGAAEATAGALRWHRRAVLIGAKTCGHSDVVRIVAAPNGTASLALYGDITSLDGKKFGGGEGLAPDIEMTAAPGEDTSVLLRVLPGRREAADLSNDRVVQRAVAVCIEQLERRSQ
ncbi:MAG: S41 family peptidase [Verrucomicrobiia bacterium]